MSPRSILVLGSFLAGLIAGVGCGPQQEFNSTETVKTAPVPTKKAPPNAKHPEAPSRGARAQPSNL